MSFVLEAKGLLQDTHLQEAQSRTTNAQKKAVAAAWHLFQSNLENDQLIWKKYLLASSGDEARARAAIVQSLEAGGVAFIGRVVLVGPLGCYSIVGY